MPTSRSFIPLMLWPDEPFRLKRRWALLPGITLERQSKQSQDLLDAFYRTLPAPLQGSHNFAVFVDRDAYVSGLKERAPGNKVSPDWLSVHDLAKLALISLFLVYPTPFRLGPELSGMFEKSGHLLRPGSIAYYPEEQTHYYRQVGLRAEVRKFRPSRIAVVKMMAALERYFRMDELRIDRIGAALAHLWSSLCTPYHEQALLSACVGLEALTTTGDKTELTHVLSERLAYLLAPRGIGRNDLYGTIKKIYGMRSAVAHGTYLKRGQKQKPWPDRIIISPKFKQIGDVC